MNSSDGDRPQRRPGFPIRTPSDQRLVGSSPRHFAASHVLHRPPDAKASTVCPYNTTHKRPNRINCYGTNLQKNQDARVHYPVLTQHHQKPTQPHQLRPAGNQRPQGKTNHQPHTPTTRLTHKAVDGVFPDTRQRTDIPLQTLCVKDRTMRPASVHPKTRDPPPASTGQPEQGADFKNKLLRKEVIQPHLPVRLPCYDFVPIANPTFDSSLTSLGHWLRVLPTFMT